MNTTFQNLLDKLFGNLGPIAICLTIGILLQSKKNIEGLVKFLSALRGFKPEPTNVTYTWYRLSGILFIILGIYFLISSFL